MWLTVDKLKEMSHELSWSGTAGLNIDAQRALVSQLLELMEDEENES